MGNKMKSQTINQTVVDMVFGSHLYGLNHADSDEDFKGVLLPSAKQIIMQQADFHISKSTGPQDSKNGAGDIDSEYFSLNKFVRLACKGETVSIDMLHAPDDKINYTSEIWKELVSLRHMFYTKNMKAYIGYVRKQAAKYGVKGSRIAVLREAILAADEIVGPNAAASKWILGEIVSYLPLGEHAELIEVDGEQIFYQICGRKFQLSNSIGYVKQAMETILNSYGQRAKLAEKNEGIDWKAVSHALRAGYQARAIYSQGGFQYPLAETPFLMGVKMGRLDWNTEVQPVLDALVDEVDALAEVSDYPDTVDMKFWDNWLYQKHMAIIKEDL
jgi:hypothetical protein